MSTGSAPCCTRWRPAACRSVVTPIWQLPSRMLKRLRPRRVPITPTSARASSRSFCTRWPRRPRTASLARRSWPRRSGMAPPPLTLHRAPPAPERPSFPPLLPLRARPLTLSARPLPPRAPPRPQRVLPTLGLPIRPAPSPAPPSPTPPPPTPTRVPPTPTVRAITVPQLRGKTLDDARAALQADGLTMTVQGVNVNIDRNIVAGQSPDVGTSVPAGAMITVQVGTGNTVVPDVAGRAREQAIKLLQDNSFRVVVRERRDPRVPAGLAIDTNPAAGLVIARGSQVELAISAGR